MHSNSVTHKKNHKSKPIKLIFVGNVPGRPQGGRHGMVFGQIPVSPITVPLVPGSTYKLYILFSSHFKFFVCFFFIGFYSFFLGTNIFFLFRCCCCVWFFFFPLKMFIICLFYTKTKCCCWCSLPEPQHKSIFFFFLCIYIYINTHVNIISYSNSVEIQNFMSIIY